MGHLTFVLKRLSAVGNKRISQFFDAAYAPRSRVIPRGFFCRCRYIIYLVISWNMTLFKVWSENTLNKKLVVAENFAEIVSKGIKAVLFIFVYFMSAWRDRILHATSDIAD